jgi:hypothetical protein
MNMRLTLGTTNTRVSPVIDTQRISTILTSNRVNSVIENYATDARVNSIDEDPSAFQYISKEITLENSASSIKIILDAHINLYSDIRAFYAISENQNFDPIFTPFPGYNNLNSKIKLLILKIVMDFLINLFLNQILLDLLHKNLNIENIRLHR